MTLDKSSILQDALSRNRKDYRIYYAGSYRKKFNHLEWVHRQGDDSTMNAEFNLPIQNMATSVTHLCPGGVYLVFYESSPLREFVGSILLNAAVASNNSRHYWITRNQDETIWSLKSPTISLLTAAIDHKIRVFKQTVKNFEFSANRLIRDFKHFRISSDSLVILEGAESLFPNSRDTQILAAETLCQWALEKNSTLLLFAQKSFSGSETAQPDPSFAHLLCGIAYWHAQSGVYEFEVSHWFGREASTFKQKFLMNHNVTDGLSVFSVENPHEPPSVVPKDADESLVLITRTALMGHALPSGWRLVEDNDACLHAATGLVEASLVLHFDRDTDRCRLTEIVYRLRRLCGLKIRISVREINAHLRYTHEHVLMLAGANLVIPAPLAFFQFRNLLNSLYGQTFNRELNIPLADLMALAEPETVSPLLPPDLFAEFVRKSLKRGRGLSQDNSLVHLKALSGDGVTRLIDELSLTRRGDVYTSTQGVGLFIYLPGCGESDIDYALDRAFRYRWTDLIITESRHTSPETIEQALRVLLPPGKVLFPAAPSTSRAIESHNPNPAEKISHPFADVTTLAPHRQVSRVQHRPLSRLHKSSV